MGSHDAIAPLGLKSEQPFPQPHWNASHQQTVRRAHREQVEDDRLWPPRRRSGTPRQEEEGQAEDEREDEGRSPPSWWE